MIPFNPFSGLTAKIYGGIALLAIAFACVQTVRIEGFWFIDGYVKEGRKKDKRITDLIDASEKAAKIALAEKTRIEAENERKAQHALVQYKKLSADYDARLASWLRKNRDGATGLANMSKASQAATGIAGTDTAPVIPTGYALVPVNDLQLSAQCFGTLEPLQDWAKGI